MFDLPQKPNTQMYWMDHAILTIDNKQKSKREKQKLFEVFGLGCTN